MGRPRLNKGLPEGISAFRDRHGQTRYRFRAKGMKGAYIKGEPGTDDFWQQYLSLKNAAKPAIGEEKVAPGTFNDLIARFYRSSFWRGIKSENTRKVYRGQIERFRAKFGDRHVNTMTAKNVSNLMGVMAETPSAASNLKKRLSQLFDFAILMGWRRDNPTKPVKAPQGRKGGYHTWEEHEIAAYEARWPLGTRERLALALLLYTAQRRSDMVRMGPQHVKDGRIRVRQQKTGKYLEIPMHPRLREAILAAPSGQLAYLVTQSGKPFTVNGFGNWFRDKSREAGLTDCSPHGLRKAASRRMAELGMSNQLIKSITGHVTDSEVARYTREAEQVLMADMVIAQMAEADLSNQRKSDLANLAESVVNADK